MISIFIYFDFECIFGYGMYVFYFFSIEKYSNVKLYFVEEISWCGYRKVIICI